MSSRISTLEEELGVLLLDRSGKQFRLTAAGTRFLTFAEKLLVLQRDAKAEMGADALTALSIRIGAIESVLHSWLIPWFEMLRMEHPGLELELTVETTPILTDQIHRGALDMVFAALPASGDGIRNHALPSMEMVFVGNPTLHKKRNYRLEELSELDLLTFQKGSQPHATLQDLFRQHRLEPKKVHAISSISAMVQLVQGGFGVALLPRIAVQRLADYGRLKVLSVDTPLKALPIYLNYRTDPSISTVELLVKSAVGFAGGKQPNAAGTKKGAKSGVRTYKNGA